MARAYIQSGLAKRVLLVGGEVISRIMDYKDRSSCILFGDAAGAVIVGRSDDPKFGLGMPRKIKDVRLGADGRGVELIQMLAGGSARPATHATVDERQHFMHVDGRDVFRFAVTKMVDMLREIMEAHQLKPEHLGRIIPHQANIRILEAASERLGIPMSGFETNLAEYGNTSAASVPLAWDEGRAAGRIPTDKPLILMAFGGGLTWGSALIE